MPFYQHFIWHSIWNIFWHSVYFHIFGYSIQHICRHSFWHGFWHYSWHQVCHRFWFFLEYLLTKIKGPDNPTCQLRPTSSKRKVKMAWGKQEREKRWWRIGVEQVVCGRVRTSKLCMEKLCCACMCVCMDVCMDVWMYGCMDGCMDVWMDGWMYGCKYIYIYGVKWLQMTQVRQSHPLQTCSRGTCPVDVTKYHACHVKRRWMSPSATPATPTAAATTRARGNRARHQS